MRAVLSTECITLTMRIAEGDSVFGQFHRTGCRKGAIGLWRAILARDLAAANRRYAQFAVISTIPVENSTNTTVRTPWSVPSIASSDSAETPFRVT